MLGDLPILSAADGFERARLEVVTPELPPDEAVIPLRFNPTEYRLQKQNSFAEIPIPGLETPPIQYIRGASEKLSLEVLLDTSDTLDNVRDKYVTKLTGLLRINSTLHAPPIVRFVWDTSIFVGVIDSLSITYVMFSPLGVPLRAQGTMSLTAYRPVEVQVNESKKESPDVEKSVTLRGGDRLDGLAAAVYQDASRWRDIARANGIRDPRRLEVGQEIIVPRIAPGRRA
jgi:hypothetical protein